MRGISRNLTWTCAVAEPEAHDTKFRWAAEGAVKTCRCFCISVKTDTAQLQRQKWSRGAVNLRPPGLSATQRLFLCKKNMPFVCKRERDYFFFCWHMLDCTMKMCCATYVYYPLNPWACPLPVIHISEQEWTWSGRALTFNKAMDFRTRLTRACQPFHSAGAHVVLWMPCGILKAVASFKISQTWPWYNNQQWSLPRIFLLKGFQ